MLLFVPVLVSPASPATASPFIHVRKFHNLPFAPVPFRAPPLLLHVSTSVPTSLPSPLYRAALQHKMCRCRKWIFAAAKTSISCRRSTHLGFKRSTDRSGEKKRAKRIAQFENRSKTSLSCPSPFYRLHDAIVPVSLRQ